MSTGRFAWHDLRSTDPEAEKAFYGAVFGWTFEDMPMEGMTYTMISAGDLQIGGLNGIQDNSASDWISYISTDDIDGAMAKVAGSGGTNDTPAYHIPDVGHMSYHHDPEGASFALFQGEGRRAETSLPIQGAAAGVPAWHELGAGSVTDEIGFYAGFTGWGHVEWPMGETLVYHGLTFGEVPVAGAFDKNAFGDSGNPTAWRIYFEAPQSAEATAAAIKAAGGTIVQEPAHIEGTGTFMIALDPTGALFGVLESESM